MDDERPKVWALDGYSKITSTGMVSMRILMLGWEFPPFISGGLGTACYGLTKALDRRGHQISFVLPKAVDRSAASHVHVLSPEQVTPEGAAGAAALFEGGRGTDQPPVEPWDLPENARRILEKAGWSMSGREVSASEVGAAEGDFSHVTFHAVPSKITSPYGQSGPVTNEMIESLTEAQRQKVQALVNAGLTRAEAVRELTGEAPPFSSSTSTPPLAKSKSEGPPASASGAPSGPTPGFLGLARSIGEDYAGDLMGDVRRYARLVLALIRDQTFDVIHAHDWMTYPAGMAVARVTGLPLVVHLHSSEFDRSGEHVNQAVYDIERRGMHGAMRVITVSYWTKNIAVHRYGVEPDKIRVVWNGVDQDGALPVRTPIRSDDKIVLFLGRITMQKGPEYFIQAAKRVLEKMENVKFIVAGSGDMATRMIEYAASLGIGHKVLFTGFLRGNDVARIYRMADCYVMPSVSEPFGIAPLEAMSHNVPVIISKQSGVSEVLTHVLKIDFWDVDEMANKIYAVLKYPPLGQTLRHHGQFELRSLTWDGAAERCEKIYAEAAAGLRGRV